MSETPRPYCVCPDEEVLARAARVQAAILDVDGVLTDGTVYAGGSGEPLHAFHVHDGKGLRMLEEAGVAVGWITARDSPALERRAQELGVRYVLTGRADKGEALAGLCERLQIPAAECAYLGDDLIDLAAIRQAGLGAAVADAHPHVRDGADWVTHQPGGRGAARELSELILLGHGSLPAVLAAAEGLG